MKTRHVVALISCVAVLCVAGWMVWDAGRVNEVKVTRVKLQPDSPDATLKDRSRITKVSEEKNAVPAPKEQSQVSAKATTEDSALHKQKPELTNFVIPQENLSHLYIVKCSACHGRDGNGPVGSSIAGKPYDYNLQKLRDYKDNKVENTMMADLLTRTSDDELVMLAKEISAFKSRN